MLKKEAMTTSTEGGETPKRRNNSDLSAADCYLRLTDESRAFEGMSNDDLDSIYAIAFGRWAYHMSREGYIRSLNEERKRLNQQQP